MGTISGLKNPLYYLYDLCTCSDLDQTQFFNEFILQKITNTYFKQQFSQQVFCDVDRDLSYSLVAVQINSKPTYS